MKTINLSLRTLSVCGLLATSMAVLPGGSATASGVESGAIFNDPTSSSDGQQRIDNKVVELIKGAESGSRVRMSMFYAKSSGVVDALTSAHARGVDVQVVLDNSAKEYPPFQKLTEELGSDPSGSSYAVACPAKRGCVGDRAMGGVDAINHNKFFLFSNTSGTKNVVVQSSANLNEGRDGTKGFNNALVLAGNDGAYRAYDGYFNDLVAQKTNNDYYTDGRPPAQTGDAKAHFFPRKEADGKDPYNDGSTDPMMAVLEHVECTGNSKVGTKDDNRSVIRVNQHIVSRPYLAEQLAKLGESGCDVEVVQNYNPDSELEKKAMDTLTGSDGVRVAYYCADDDLWTHSKYLVVEGKYWGTKDRKLVWTGSANWSTNSLRQSDEIVLQQENGTVADAYIDNFNATRDAATHQPDKGQKAAC